MCVSDALFSRFFSHSLVFIYYRPVPGKKRYLVFTKESSLFTRKKSLGLRDEGAGGEAAGVVRALEAWFFFIYGDQQ